MTVMADNRFDERWSSRTGLAQLNAALVRKRVRTRSAFDRRSGRLLLIVLASVVFACFAASMPGAGQAYPGVDLQPPPTNPFPEMDEMDPQLARRQLRALNAERQKELVKDTAKLLKLAQALNAQTRAENAESLSAAQWKEIDRIEKLAHNVKQKMVETYGGGPAFRPPMVPMIR
ncbi:MAG TPA: hypothetical protein VND90_05250 [Terracidiphilus sp.]|nr:hypothetical protein [Terracidiphilus sp.]